MNEWEKIERIFELIWQIIPSEVFIDIHQKNICLIINQKKKRFDLKLNASGVAWVF